MQRVMFLRWQREHGALLLGVLLAGLLIGWWRTAPAGAAPVAGARLSGYAAAGLGHTYRVGGSAAPAPPAAPAEAQPAASAVVVRDTNTVVGPPSLTTAQIDTILAAWGSPAAGQGADFVAAGRQYGIDPAFGLAFYAEESGCGTKGVARFTHGIGNIRWIPGYDSYEGYRSYPDFAKGIEDWFKLIHDLYVDGWGLRTVDAIVPRYAPAGDGNDPAAYIAAVRGFVATWRAGATAPG